MKLWFDHTNPAPDGFIWCKTAHVFKAYLLGNWNIVSTVDIACGSVFYENDFEALRILRWLSENSKQSFIWEKANFKFRFHDVTEAQFSRLFELVCDNNWMIEEEVSNA